MKTQRLSLARRVLQEHRKWIWPLVVLIGLNVVAMVAGILPMSRSVAASESRAAAAAVDAATAASELSAATATRDGRDLATRELGEFHTDVLPATPAEARQLLQLRIAQLARSHDVTFARSAVNAEALDKSALVRLHATVDLVGRYRDVRRFLYDVETSPSFVVVDSIVLSEGEDASAPLDLTLALSTYFKGSADGR